MKKCVILNACLLVAAICLVIIGGCSDKGPSAPVRLATTTSTANSGLLDYLLPEFEKDTGLKVEYIPTGTGRALKHGRDGDVDAVLVHAPPSEEAFVADGFGVKRVPVMWNDFVIVGPADDPAGVGSSQSAAEALRILSEQNATFISRGDDSGTHKKEKLIWEAAAITPAGGWYIEAGQGMGACLTMADNQLGYVMTDRGTYLAMADKLEIEVVYEGDAALVNPYAIIAVNPEKYPDVNHTGTERLIEWLTSARARELIAAFRVGDEQLFKLFDE